MKHCSAAKIVQMKNVIILIFFLVSGNAFTQVVTNSVTTVTSAASGKEKNSSDLAVQATSEKLPQISAAILRTELQQEKNPEVRQKLILKLGEILVTEHCPEEALTILNSKDLLPLPLVSFWKAQALLALGKPAEAEPLLKALVLEKEGVTKEYGDAINLALARTERALGKNEEALKALESVPANTSLTASLLVERCAVLLALKRHEEVEKLLKEEQELKQHSSLLYLYALAAWQRGDEKEALRRFEMKVSSSNESWIAAATVVGIANCDMVLKKPQEAQALIEKYLQENPNTPLLPELMARLESLYVDQEKKDGIVFYKWANDTTKSYRAAYAMLPLARMLERQGHCTKAEAVEETFLKRFPEHPLAGEVRLEMAKRKLNQGNAAAALSFLADRTSDTPVLRGRMAFVRGLAEAALKHPERAEEEFQQAALLDPSLAGEIQYNQTLLHLVQSSTKEPGLSALQKTEAPLTTSPTDEVEQKEYLALLGSDHGDRASADHVIKKAQAFLITYPHSSFVNQVRMKLGEALLRKGLVRDARVEFESVGRAASNSELGCQALLFAAQAAARSMDPKSVDDAIMILEQVAQSHKGSYHSWQARLEQAALKNAQALPLEAIAIDDQIIAATDATPELRYAAQMSKGDTLSSLGSKDPSNYRAAITTWRSLADMPELPPRWRNQALCKIGLIEEKLGECDTALATYYEAMKNPRSQEPEQLWHDKAAFEAARLLEVRHQWNEAIQVYQQIITEGGPRAAEAKARISKLRLENLLWD